MSTSSVPTGADLENAMVNDVPAPIAAPGGGTPELPPTIETDSAAPTGKGTVTQSATTASVFSGQVAATSWTIRDFHESDIERAVQLCEDTRLLPDSTPLNLVDLVLSLRSQHPAVVAVSKNILVGFIIASSRR